MSTRSAEQALQNYLVVIPWTLARARGHLPQATVGHVQARSLKAATKFITWFMRDEDALTDLLVEPGTRRVSNKRPLLKDYGISVGRPHIELAADVVELDTDWANAYFISKDERARWVIGQAATPSPKRTKTPRGTR